MATPSQPKLKRLRVPKLQPHHKDAHKSLLVITIGVAVLLMFMGIYVNYRVSVGKAVFMGTGDTQWTPGETIDLTQIGTIRITPPFPDTPISIPILTSTSVYDDSPIEYELKLEKVPALSPTTYHIEVSVNNDGDLPSTRIGSDILDVGSAGDRTQLYLFDEINPPDTIPDLEISFANGEIRIQNLHFITPDVVFISIRNSTTDVRFPQVIRLAPEQEITALIRANSSIAPQEITATVTGSGMLALGTDFQSNEETNASSVSFTYTAPATSEAAVLNISVVVQGEEHHAYYTLAIGNVLYALDDPSRFPTMIARQSALDPELMSVTIVLNPTTQLQPLALPCLIDTERDTQRDTSRSASLFSTVFADTAVQRVYSYNRDRALVWTPNAPSDIARFAPTQGYFVELASETASEGERTVTIECQAVTLNPVAMAPPNPGASYERFRMREGWTLFALPSIVPRPLTDFTENKDFRLFECPQNYACHEIPNITPLDPGKPYWIYNAEPFEIRFLYERS